MNITLFMSALKLPIDYGLRFIINIMGAMMTAGNIVENEDNLIGL